MDIVKKNLVSIICGVVALVAIVVWLLPMRSMLDSQKTQLEQYKGEHDKLVQLARKPRKLPDVKLPSAQGGATASAASDEGGGDNLPGFPSRTLVEQGQQVMEKVKAGSAAVLKKAIQLNQRPQLIDHVLPQVDNVMGVQFRDAYLRMLGNEADPIKTSYLAREVLHAGTPPTPEEIQAKAYDLWKNEYVGTPSTAKKVWELNNQPQNLGEVTQEFAERVKLLPQELRQQHAEQCMIYMDPDAFTRSPSITYQSNPSPPEVFFAQVGLWIQQDVCDAIVRINGDSKSVLEAPIKHLRRIMLPVGPDLLGIDPQALGMTATAGRPMSSGAVGSSRNLPPSTFQPRTPTAARPGAATGGGGGEGAAATPNTKDYKRSPTGRVSNSLYDVVPFTLVIRVDARKIPQVLKELELNRFFTIHQVNAAIIDTAATMKRDGFVYGNEDAQGHTVAATVDAPTTRPAGGDAAAAAPATQPAGDAATASAPKGVPVPVAELTIDCEALLLRAWTTPLMPADIKKALKIEDKPAAGEGTSPVAANQ